jgi:hypothetical protein
MAKSNVRLDYKELVKLKEQIMLFGDPTQMDKFFESCAKELAARLLAKVIKRTPVGQYDEGSGKVGGTLRRGWTAGQDSNATTYAKSLNVTKTGNDYVIEIINPVEYASYVEFGHRTRNHKGWVEGHFMLTISEEEIRNSAPRILEKKLKNYLKGCFT